MKNSNEEEYFARQEIEKKRKLAEEISSKLKAEEKANLKELHFNHCGKCGEQLQELAFKGVMIDKCFACGAVLLDDGELEKLAGAEGSVITSIIGLFK